MSRSPTEKMDAPAAWKAWSTSRSAEAGAQFLDRIAAWTDGTAAQLTRGVTHRAGSGPSRDEIAARLHRELGVLAGGEPLTYLVALNLARRNVIEDLRSGRPA